MTKTILITGATAGFGAPPRDVRSRRLARHRHRAPRRRLRSFRRSSATRSFRSRSTCATARRSRAWRNLSPPWGEIDLLLNNAGLAPPTDPLPDTDWDADRGGDRDQRHRAGRSDPRAAAQADRAQGADHQPVLGRRDLSLQGRRGLRRDQGVRPPILARPSLRSRRNRRARHLGRAGHGRDGVHAWSAPAATRRRRTSSTPA